MTSDYPFFRRTSLLPRFVLRKDPFNAARFAKLLAKRRADRVAVRMMNPDPSDSRPFVDRSVLGITPDGEALKDRKSAVGAMFPASQNTARQIESSSDPIRRPSSGPERIRSKPEEETRNSSPPVPLKARAPAATLNVDMFKIATYGGSTHVAQQQQMGRKRPGLTRDLPYRLFGARDQGSPDVIKTRGAIKAATPRHSPIDHQSVSQKVGSQAASTPPYRAHDVSYQSSLRRSQTSQTEVSLAPVIGTVERSQSAFKRMNPPFKDTSGEALPHRDRSPQVYGQLVSGTSDSSGQDGSRSTTSGELWVDTRLLEDWLEGFLANQLRLATGNVTQTRY